VHTPESPTLTTVANDSDRGEFADSLPDTSPYFDAWLDSLRPSSPRIDIPAPASQLDFEGTLRIDCHVSGAVHSPAGTLMMGETAELQGNVFVAVAIIDGFVRGDIRATERVELGRQGRVIGSIETPTLAIQPGAIFEGQCHFLPPPRKTDEEDPARSSADDSVVSQASSRRTRSKPDKHEGTEAMALAAAR
jgi:cytoskeletal protein CcmA (bactofilin family)